MSSLATTKPIPRSFLRVESRVWSNLKGVKAFMRYTMYLDLNHGYWSIKTKNAYKLKLKFPFMKMFLFIFFGLRPGVSLKLSTKGLITVAMGGQR